MTASCPCLSSTAKADMSLAPHSCLGHRVEDSVGCTPILVLKITSMDKLTLGIIIPSHLAGLNRLARSMVNSAWAMLTWARFG
jgi:hypothetical protein